MITDKITIPKSDLVEKFYNKPFKFSYSSLNKLLYSPISFYNWYILNEREDALESYFIEGKAIHCLLLEQEKFDKQFIVTPGNLPTATSKKVVEAMYKVWKTNSDQPTTKLKDYSKHILSWLVEDNTFQNLANDKDLTKEGAKTGDEKRLAKILTTSCFDYFSYLQSSGDRDVMDQETYDRCLEGVNVVRDDKSIMELLSLGDSSFELLEVHNELPLEMELKDQPFGLKGIIDNLVIDYENKEVRINDVKTTSKSLNEFESSLEYYKYWMQAAIYLKLAIAFVQKELGKEQSLKEWNIKFHFIVLDRYNNVYAFPVSNESMLDWQARLKEIITKANYHYTKRDYKLLYEFALGQVKL